MRMQCASESKAGNYKYTHCVAMQQSKYCSQPRFKRKGKNGLMKNAEGLNTE